MHLCDSKRGISGFFGRAYPNPVNFGAVSVKKSGFGYMCPQETDKTQKSFFICVPPLDKAEKEVYSKNIK